MKKFSLLAGLVLALGLATGAAYALAGKKGDNGGARLIGFSEVPANSTTGVGEFKLEIHGSDRISYRLTYRALEASTLFAHIHLGQREVAGGVAAFLCGGGGKPACPATEGTVEGNIVPADVVGPASQGIAAGEFAELVRAIRAGKTYANVHTSKFPGGEIRGQIGGGGNKKDGDDKKD
jgi:CHRD domain-containing protein